MFKNLLIPVTVLLLLSSCGAAVTREDNPAYHNPAVQPFTDSIAEAPERADLYFRRAEALSDIQSDSLALIDVRKALSLDPHNPQYTFTIGYLQLQLGQTKEAVKTLEQNLVQSPGNVNVRILLSRAFLADGKTDAAAAQIARILAAAPGHPAALMMQADIKAAEKDTSAAMNILREVLAGNPQHYEASYQLADWYKAASDPKAITQYRYTFSLDTNDVNPLFEIGDYYEQQQQEQQAKEAFIYCIQKDRDFTNAYLELGKIYYREHATDKALRHFDLAINTMPNSAEAYYNKGLCFEQLKQKDSAGVAFRQALVFDRDMKAAAEALQRLKK